MQRDGRGVSWLVMAVGAEHGEMRYDESGQLRQGTSRCGLIRMETDWQ